MALIQVTIKNEKTKKQQILINTDHIVSMVGNCITLDTGTEMTIAENIAEVVSLAGGELLLKPVYITLHEVIGFNHIYPWEFSSTAATKETRINIYDIEYIDTTTVGPHKEEITVTKLVLKNKKKHTLVTESKDQVNKLIRQAENKNS